MPKVMPLRLPRRPGQSSALRVRAVRRRRQVPRRESDACVDAQTTTALLGMVSHELRTPLQTLMTVVELLETTESIGQVRPLAARMMDTLERMAIQLETLGQYARLARGPQTVRHQEVRMAELLRRAIDERMAEARRLGQAIELEMGDAADLAIDSDPVRLGQIVDNYLGNALKYGGGGAIVVSCAVARTSHGGIDAIEIGVKDQGPGVTDEERLQIWKPYFRGRRSIGKAQGSGLGLAVVKLLASTAGWQVGVRGDAGTGATFFVRIPIDDAGRPAAPTDAIR